MEELINILEKLNGKTISGVNSDLDNRLVILYFSDNSEIQIRGEYDEKLEIYVSTPQEDCLVRSK